MIDLKKIPKGKGFMWFSRLFIKYFYIGKSKRPRDMPIEESDFQGGGEMLDALIKSGSRLE